VQSSLPATSRRTMKNTFHFGSRTSPAAITVGLPTVRAKKRHPLP
jgi:hypothetical protein